MVMTRKSVHFLWVACALVTAIVLVESLRLQRRTSQIAVAEARMRGILQTMAVYASDYNDQWPPSFQVLLDISAIKPEFLLDPRLPSAPPSQANSSATQRHIRCDFYFAPDGESYSLDNSHGIEIYDNGQSGGVRLVVFSDG